MSGSSKALLVGGPQRFGRQKARSAPAQEE
jgi:hypothetical protein